MFNNVLSDPSVQVASALEHRLTTPTMNLQHPTETVQKQNVVVATELTAHPAATYSRSVASIHAHAFAGVNGHCVFLSPPHEPKTAEGKVDFAFNSSEWYSNIATGDFSSARWTTMNFGFADDSSNGRVKGLELRDQDMLAWSSLQLYWQLLQDVPVEGQELLECGSGAAVFAALKLIHTSEA